MAVDHLNRIGVTDAGNARVAFYSVTYDGPSAPPVATFEFQLDTTVAVSDFSMGLAEQWGTLPGLDEKGRFLATDPLRRRILRFELPELGIVNPAANEGEGSFEVAVPSQKLGAVLNVVTTVTPVESDVTITSGPTPATPTTIAPGQLASYTFTYSSPHPRTTFAITAAGSTPEGPVEAEPASVVARKSCAPSCAAVHTHLPRSAVRFADRGAADGDRER